MKNTHVAYYTGPGKLFHVAPIEPVKEEAVFAGKYATMREAYTDLISEEDFLPLNSNIDSDEA